VSPPCLAGGAGYRAGGGGDFPAPAESLAGRPNVAWAGVRLLAN